MSSCFFSAPNPPKMSTPAATAETAESKAAALARKKKGTAAATAAVITGGGHHRAAVAPFPIGRGHGAAAATAPSMAGFGAAAAATAPSMAGFGAAITASSKAGFGAAAAASAMAGFGTAAASSSMAASGAADSSPIYCRGGSTSASPVWWDAADGGSPVSPAFRRPASWDPLWEQQNSMASIPRDNNSHPPGGFMSFLNNQSQSSQNSHYVGAPSHHAPFKAPRAMHIGGSSPPLVAPPMSQQDQDPINVDSEEEVGRTEKRILWTLKEDERLMRSWINNSTDSTCGADRKNEQYWGDVTKEYNMTTPANRKRNPKQAKDRWHKINRWTDLFHCAWMKAKRIYTSGYNDQDWIDMARKFYEEDNKALKLGPFVLIDVWYACRDEPKWKTYNDDKKARKRKGSNQEEETEENSEYVEGVLKRPIGQKAAKKAAFAAKYKSKGIEIDEKGKSKESAVDVDKLDRFSKIQSEATENRMKVLELQQKLSSEKLEATKIAHLAAVENKEAKMMECYNSLLLRDTSTISSDEKAEHVAALKCFRKRLFPESM